MEVDWEYEKAPELLIGYDEGEGAVTLAWGREWDSETKKWPEPFLQPSTIFFKGDED